MSINSDFTAVEDFKFSANALSLAVSSFGNGTHNLTFYHVGTSSISKSQEYKRDNFNLKGLSWSKTGKLLATWSTKSEVVVYSLKTNNQHQIKSKFSKIVNIVFDTEEENLVVISNKGQV